jgi:fluoroquinolone resistance protein
MQTPSRLAMFYKKTFNNITQSNGILKNTEYEQCHFKKIALTNYVIDNCRFISCTFEDCVFSAIKPTNSSLFDLTFANSKVIGVDFTLAKKVDAMTFNNSQINYSNFRFLILPKMKLTNCIAKETDFTEADLSDSDFNGTNFEGARFFKTNLTKTNFKNATNYYIDIHNNTIKKAVFSYPEAIHLLQCLDINVEY